MPAGLIQRKKSSAKEEMVTPRVGCWPKFEPTIHTRFSRNNHFTYNPVSHKWVGADDVRDSACRSATFLKNRKE